MKHLSLICFVCFCLLCMNCLCQQEMFDTSYNELCRIKAKQLIDNVKQATSKENVNEAILILQKSILSEKVKAENTIPLLRLSIYTEIFVCLKEKQVTHNLTKQLLLDILADGIVSNGVVNDNTQYIRERIIKYLSELVYNQKIRDLSPQALICIEDAYKQDWNERRYIVLLLVASGSSMTNSILRKNYRVFPVNFYGTYYSEEWAATLILAQMGDKESIKHLLIMSEKTGIIHRFSLLIEDLSTIHNDMIVRYLYEYLKSELVLPKLKSTLPLQYVSSYTAVALSKMLQGFPVHKNYNDIKAIEDCRKWMAEQKEFVFLETP